MDEWKVKMANLLAALKLHTVVDKETMDAM